MDHKQVVSIGEVRNRIDDDDNVEQSYAPIAFSDGIPSVTNADLGGALDVLRRASVARDSRGRQLWKVNINAAKVLVDKRISNAPITNVNVGASLDNDQLALVMSYLSSIPEDERLAVIEQAQLEPAP